MENNKLSYISWTVIIAAILIFAGWFLTHGSKANLKTYQNDKVKIEFEYYFINVESVICDPHTARQ